MEHVKNISAILDLIERIVKLLADHPNHPGLQQLRSMGASILTGIVSFTTAHPFIVGGLILIILLPWILKVLAIWIRELRSAWNDLPTSIQSDVQQLQGFVAMSTL